ncbi:MAG: hypothetical protein KC646_10950, partial [Candidatus Cloacimonetes bacterium]|nr:hypothetical protein [Candidatus Cloacimonadota bacterium]
MSGLFNQTVKFLTIMLILINSISAATITRSLTSGWNLVSIPVSQSTSVVTVLSSDFRAQVSKI